jgi:hypothetical protein
MLAKAIKASGENPEKPSELAASNARRSVGKKLNLTDA